MSFYFFFFLFLFSIAPSAAPRPRLITKRILDPDLPGKKRLAGARGPPPSHRVGPVVYGWISLIIIIILYYLYRATRTPAYCTPLRVFRRIGKKNTHTHTQARVVEKTKRSKENTLGYVYCFTCSIRQYALEILNIELFFHNFYLVRALVDDFDETEGRGGQSRGPAVDQLHMLRHLWTSAVSSTYCIHDYNIRSWHTYLRKKYYLRVDLG